MIGVDQSQMYVTDVDVCLPTRRYELTFTANDLINKIVKHFEMYLDKKSHFESVQICYFSIPDWLSQNRHTLNSVFCLHHGQQLSKQIKIHNMPLSSSKSSSRPTSSFYIITVIKILICLFFYIWHLFCSFDFQFQNCY